MRDVTGLIVDLFAGGGGASIGIAAALGREPDIAVNHSPIAIAVHKRNHPQTKHFTCDVYEVDPHEATGGKPVELLWASPDCTHHSNAKGGKPRDSGLRMLAWIVVRWAAQTLPRAICVENVPEFRGWGPLNAKGKPIKALKGTEFRRWCKALEELGYQVDHRVLDSSEYGAHTKRRRLFVVARLDGAPEWPEVTHGTAPGLQKPRPAFECIDWTLPCPSIFERQRPLAEKTMARIAEGLRRYVFDAAEPFILKFRHDSGGASIAEPLPTISSGGSNSRRPAGAGHALGLALPTLVQTGYGEREGQRPRTLDGREPLGTVVASGAKHAVVSAWMVKHFGGVYGHELTREIGTITARDHHALAAATLIEMRGTQDRQIRESGRDLRSPLPVVSAGGIHVAEVRAFLLAYYGTGVGQDMREPMRTITAKHRLGLVTIHGVDYQIVDIGMRMLEPDELLRAQFGEYAEGYEWDVQKQLRSGRWVRLAKADKVRLVGNSVVPIVAREVVRANRVQVEAEVAA